MRSPVVRLAWVVLALSLTACGAPTGEAGAGEAGQRQASQGGAAVTSAAGDTAVWETSPSSPPGATEATFVALVSRLGCSGGQTGQVLRPDVVEQDDEVVITFTVEPLPSAGGDYTCQGNPPVPYVVELSRPLDHRRLLDGACLSGEASTTSFCTSGAARHVPGT